MASEKNKGRKKVIFKLVITKVMVDTHGDGYHIGRPLLSFDHDGVTHCDNNHGKQFVQNEFHYLHIRISF